MPQPKVLHEARFKDIVVYDAFLVDLQGRSLRQTTFIREDGSIVVSMVDESSGRVLLDYEFMRVQGTHTHKVAQD